MKEYKFAVIGLGRFGTTLVKSLALEGREVIAVDRDYEAVEAIKDDASLALVMDATQREGLLEHGLHEVNVAIVCIGENFEANVFAALLLKQLGAVRVVARAQTKLQADILLGIGVDEVIRPEDESARRLARTLARPNLLEFIELADDHGIVQIKTPAVFVGKSIAELDLRRRFHVNLVAIKRGAGAVISVPKPEDILSESDILIVIGRENEINRMVK